MGTRDVTSFHLLSHFGHTFNCIFTGCHGMSRDFPGIPVTKGVLQRVEHNCKCISYLHIFIKKNAMLKFRKNDEKNFIYLTFGAVLQG